MAIVRLERLTKIYERAEAPAVKDVSIDIGHGDFMVLLGPSGCGKTTTLRMIAGLESISDGILSIDGNFVNEVPAKDRDIAMVFQSYALYPHMTVWDNLAFGLKRRSIPREEIERRVTNVAATLGLSEFLRRKPHALSGGQRQRVALGRAIVRHPKVFLFDEPLSNLDAALRVSTRGEIAALHRRLGATMIYVTHDQVEAMTLGTRICIMNKGRVAQIGTPLDVYHNPANTFVAGFLGNPPMNLLPAVVTDDEGGCTLAVGSLKLTLPPQRMPPLPAGTTVTLGIRPEHVSPHDRGYLQGFPFSCEVVQIERLGAETLIFAELGDAGARLVARSGGDVAFGLGDRITLYADLSAAHVFDGAGNALHLQTQSR